MVLCIPLTMTLKFACENNKGTQWIAVLLGPEAPTESIPPVSKRGRVEEAREAPGERGTQGDEGGQEGGQTGPRTRQ